VIGVQGVGEGGEGGTNKSIKGAHRTSKRVYKTSRGAYETSRGANGFVMDAYNCGRICDEPCKVGGRARVYEGCIQVDKGAYESLKAQMDL
jgi:hypothetical protein